MSEIMRCRPNKLEAYGTVLGCCGAIAGFVIAGCFLMQFLMQSSNQSLNDLVGFGIMFGIGIMMLKMTQTIYDESNTVIIFENDGFRVTGGCWDNYRYMLWKEISYAYYMKNYKGNVFIVLSGKILDKKGVKGFVKKKYWSSKICFDDTAVIPFNNGLQKAEQEMLEKIIKDNVLYIDKGNVY